MAMTYAQLSTAIQDYIEAGDANFLAHIPDFVRSAERKIFNMVQLPLFRKTATAPLTLGSQFFTFPVDFLAPYSFAVIDAAGNYNYLLNKDPEYIRAIYPNPTSTGTPTHYAIQDSLQFIVGPTPSAAFSTELQYFYYPASIVDAGTSWLGNNFETVLLYGSLIEANMFIKGEQDMAQLYQTKFDDAMGELKKLADGRDRRDTYRSGFVRVPSV